MDQLENTKNEGLKTVQWVPEGYFDRFSVSLMQKIKAEEELKGIAPTLVGISRKPVQFVPAGYFEQFRVNIDGQQAPIVRMSSWRKLVSYAVAAVVAGVLVAGALLFRDNRASSSFNYEYYSKIDVSAELNKVPEESLDQYLNTLTSIGGAGHELNVEVSEGDADQGLEDVSDDALINYLQNTGEQPVGVKRS